MWSAPQQNQTTSAATTDDPTSVEKENPMLGLLNKDKETPEEIHQVIDIDYQKFFNHVLPKALKLEIFITPGFYHGVGFMTQILVDAPPIYKHDKPDDRYPISAWMFAEKQMHNNWFQEVNQYYDVLGIIREPDKYQTPYNWLGEEENEGLFVIKDMCYEGETPIGMFPNTLLPELHECRAAIETYSQQTKCFHERGKNEAYALSVLGKIVRVTMTSGTVKYRIL